MDKVCATLVASLLFLLPLHTSARTSSCNSGWCETYFYFETYKTSERKTLRYRINEGQVELTSVCAEHPYGSLARRQCRSAAYQLFRDTCASDRQNNNRRKTYCNAASRFSPVQ